QRWDRDLDVDDRLGGETGNGCRTDVLNSKRKFAKHQVDSLSLYCKGARPGGIVWCDDDHVEPRRVFGLTPNARAQRRAAFGASAAAGCWAAASPRQGFHSRSSRPQNRTALL